MSLALWLHAIVLGNFLSTLLSSGRSRQTGDFRGGAGVLETIVLRRLVVTFFSDASVPQEQGLEAQVRRVSTTRKLFRTECDVL